MRTLGRFAAVIVLAGLGLALAGAVGLPQLRTFFTAGATRGLSKLDLQPLSQRSVVFARDGSVLEVLHAEVDRAPIALDRVPAHVVNAVLDTEDARFFHHGPIDLRSMTRALVTNVSAGKVAEGGSTITQQLVKNALLTPRQDVQRKVKEAVLAIRLGKQMSKREILERYLNTVYFGNGAYGVQAAAERYFGVDGSQLTPAQGALLAGLIRNPVGYDPFRFPELSRQRRDVVVDRMVMLAHLTPEQAKNLKATPLPAKPPDLPEEHDDYFTSVVKAILLGDANNHFHLGDTGQDRYRSLFEGGLRIHTTLDPPDQAAAEDKVRTILPETGGRFNAALVSVEPATGAVRAMVGGPDFDRSKFNLVTDGIGRQPGSSFKVFTLMAALEQGHSPADSVDGTSPCSIPNPGGIPNPWEPANVEGEGGGPMTLTDATVHSINCAYARLVKIVGPKAVVDVAHRMGITNDLQPVLAITLGTEEVNPIQMAGAYATLAADGEHHRPYFVDRIEDSGGKTIFQVSTKGDRAVSSALARAETRVLEQVVQRGTGRAAAVPGWQVAGKTGTTDDFGNAWFVGYTPKLATAVWMGSPTAVVPMFDVGGIRVYGGTYPARIFGAYMREAMSREAVVGFPAPDPKLFYGGRFLKSGTESSTTATTTKSGPTTVTTGGPPDLPPLSRPNIGPIPTFVIPTITLPPRPPPATRPHVTRPPPPTIPPTTPPPTRRRLGPF